MLLGSAQPGAGRRARVQSTGPVSVLRILLVEDSPADAEITLRELKRGGLEFESRCIETEVDLIRECEEFKPQIILSDFAMPHFDGLSALRVVRVMRPDL